jgi:hypothetical protein
MDGAYAGAGRLAGYAYLKTRNPAFARVAAASIFGGIPLTEKELYPSRHFEGPDVLDPIEETVVSTNGAAQTSLTAIEVMELCADQLPPTIPSRPKDDHANRPMKEQ